MCAIILPLSEMVDEQTWMTFHTSDALAL